VKYQTLALLSLFLSSSSSSLSHHRIVSVTFAAGNTSTDPLCRFASLSFSSPYEQIPHPTFYRTHRHAFKSSEAADHFSCLLSKSVKTKQKRAKSVKRQQTRAE